MKKLKEEVKKEEVKKIIQKIIKEKEEKMVKEIKADVYCDVCGGALKEVGTNLFSIDGKCEHYPNS